MATQEMSLLTSLQASKFTSTFGVWPKIIFSKKLSDPSKTDMGSPMDIGQYGIHTVQNNAQLVCKEFIDAPGT